MFGGDGTHCFARKTSRDYKKVKPSPFFKKFLHQSKPSTYEPEPKKANRVQIWNKSIRFLLADDLSHIFNFQILLFNLNLLSTSQIYSQLTQNHQDLLSLQRRNPADCRFWTRLGNYCSKRSRSKHNNQFTRNTPSRPAIALVSKTKLFEQSSSSSFNYSQPWGNNGDERRSTLPCGAQNLDTSSYQVSDLEDIEFNWEDSQLDSVFRPGIGTPFSPTTFDDFLMVDGSVENPILLDEEQDKENAASSSPESVRPAEPPMLQRSRAFGARIENVPDYLYRNLFQ